MSMPAITRRWTVEEVLALPDDGNRYEVVDGELLVTPSPALRHEVALLELFRPLDAYVRRHKLGTVFVSRGDVFLGATRYVQPDLFFVPVPIHDLPEHWRDLVRPALVAEVLSASSARGDRFVKRVAYQGAQVEEYWIVDLDARLFEHWQPGEERPRILTDWLEWQPAGASEPFRLDLVRYFAVVFGEDEIET